MKHFIIYLRPEIGLDENSAANIRCKRVYYSETLQRAAFVFYQGHNYRVWCTHDAYDVVKFNDVKTIGNRICAAIERIYNVEPNRYE